MKYLLPVLLLLGCTTGAKSQFFSQPDTIFIQTFTVDPSDTMLNFPSGNDNHWVNWDADNLPTVCGDDEPVPRNWFWDSDLGDLTNPPVNFAFTSCSFLEGGQPNQNWLITPPVFITDSTMMLTWRSSPFEGPGYMDGYKVLVSTTTNEPFLDAFTDTIFVAAEMTQVLKNGSLKLEDYVFSSGYIHASGYTNSDYYFLIHPTAQAYTGKLEPHQKSLANYVGHSIYIAFLHDSTDDSILQLDDIAIVQGISSATVSPPDRLDLHLHVQPNPVVDYATVSWKTRSASAGWLTVSDILGRTMLEWPVNDLNAGYTKLNLGTLPTGTYACTLRTNNGWQSQVFMKR